MKCCSSVLGVGAVAVLAFGVGRWSSPLEPTASARQPDRSHPAPGQPSRPQPDKAQPDKAPPGLPPGMDPAAMERMMKASTPGEQHKLLECMTGEWEGTVKFWMTPGTEPMVSTGSVTREWNLGGRFLFEHVTAHSDMGPFEAYGAIGYNTLENRYESAWLEDYATYMTFMTGTYDAGKKVFTFTGECLNPMTGKREKQRHTVDVSNPTRHVMAGYGPGPDGKEFKNFEGVLEKKP